MFTARRVFRTLGVAKLESMLMPLRFFKWMGLALKFGGDGLFGRALYLRYFGKKKGVGFTAHGLSRMLPQ